MGNSIRRHNRQQPPFWQHTFFLHTIHEKTPQCRSFCGADAGQMRGSAAKYGCHPEKLKNRY